MCLQDAQWQGCYTRNATTRRRLACEAHAAGANTPADSERGRCPFSQAASFFRAAPPPSATPGSTLHASPLPAASLTPLGRAGGAEAAHPSLWLAAGQSGQDVPGRLTPGLRKLADLDEFLIEVCFHHSHQDRWCGCRIFEFVTGSRQQAASVDCRGPVERVQYCRYQWQVCSKLLEYRHTCSPQQ